MAPPVPVQENIPVPPTTELPTNAAEAPAVAPAVDAAVVATQTAAVAPIQVRISITIDRYIEQS